MTALTYLAIAFWLLSGFGVWGAWVNVEKGMGSVVSMVFVVLGWPFFLMGGITEALLLHSRARKWK